LRLKVVRERSIVAAFYFYIVPPSSAHEIGFLAPCFPSIRALFHPVASGFQPGAKSDTPDSHFIPGRRFHAK
jgi:hypothetical protein